MSEKETLINQTLDKVRHFLQRDGGDIELVKLEGDIVYVTMKGACEGCSMAYTDTKEFVEIILQEEVDPKLEVKLMN